MWLRLRLVFGEAPFLFFAVVIGVALTFRVAVGFARDAATPPVVAPSWPVAGATHVTTGPEPGLASGSMAPERPASASASGTPGGLSASTPAAVGAGSREQPVGSPSPSPARVAPRPRGHGRRPLHGTP